ncbi:toll/interleukin-1 receptor domain-containing protein [Bacillus toyonensis]
MYDFFISYNSKDTNIAEWISYTLEEAGYKIFVQAWGLCSRK